MEVDAKNQHERAVNILISTQVLRGSAAWVTCNEAPEGEPSALEAINVFERRDGRWYMVHHQAGPVFVQQPPQ